MEMNEVPSGERIHIGFFGRINAGKSSLVNAVTGQQMALVSEKGGTTTDPVKKAMELLPLGPVVIIDTAGLDDTSSLGSLRMAKTKEVLRQIHIAVLVVDCLQGLTSTEEELIQLFEEGERPYLIVYNKSDLLKEPGKEGKKEIYVSAKTGKNIQKLKERIGELSRDTGSEKRLVGDLLKEGDLVILVIPIDKAAPKGRLILPQQQTIRDILDSKARVMVCIDTQLKDTLEVLKQPPGLVITDSQVFEKVAEIVPDNIPLTSFSILFARYKGNLKRLTEGAYHLNLLQDRNKILISEGCTHHRQCGDIGSQKLPMWIKEFTGKEIDFQFTSGGEYPEDLSSFALIIHCGGCMLNEKEMQYRIREAKKQNIPITNYGTAIAHMKGILKRSTDPVNI